jgi:hypothetical protein
MYNKIADVTRSHLSRTMAQQPVTLVGNVQHLYLLPTYPYP